MCIWHDIRYKQMQVYNVYRKYYKMLILQGILNWASNLLLPQKKKTWPISNNVLGLALFPCNIWIPNIRHPKSHRTLWSSPCFPVFFRGGLLHADTLIQAALLSIIVNHIHHPKAIKGCQVDQPENSKQPMVSWQVGSQNRDHPRGGWQQTWSFQMEMAKKESLSP